MGISSLPNELLRRIFGFVAQSTDNPKESARALGNLEVVARTSKLFNAVATPLLYRCIRVPDVDSLLLLVESFQLHNPGHLKLVKQLSLTSARSAPPTLCKRILACRFPALDTLQLDRTTSKYFNVMTEIPCLETLRSLSLVGFLLPMLNGSTFPNLQELYLTEFKEASKGFYPSFPKLRSLSLDNISSNPNVCNWMSHAIKSLRSVTICIGRSGGFGIMSHTQLLTSITQLANSLPADVETLNVRSQTRKYREPLEACIRRFQGLRRFHFEGGVIDDVLEILPPSLEYVEIVGIKARASKIMLFLQQLERADSFPKLQFLPVIVVQAFTGQPMQGLKAACTSAYSSLLSKGTVAPPHSYARPNWLWDTQAGPWRPDAFDSVIQEDPWPFPNSESSDSSDSDAD